MTSEAMELYEFNYDKYGEHVIAVRIKGQGGLRLFDTVKLFAQNNTRAEYERVKGEAAAWAKQFVAQFNSATPATKDEMMKAWQKFKAQNLHSFLRQHLVAADAALAVEGCMWGLFSNGFMAARGLL